MIDKNKDRIILTLPKWQILWLKSHASGSNLSVSEFVEKVIIGSDALDDLFGTGLVDN